MLKILFFGILATLIMNPLFPICFWAIYGEGASADRILPMTFVILLSSCAGTATARLTRPDLTFKMAGINKEN